MTTPSPSQPPGWYPDPAGSGLQRYWDGARWGPMSAPAAPPRPPAKSPRAFVILLIASFFTGVVTFILMQLAFGAASNGDGALVFEVVGFALFIVWLACVVAFLVGLIGAIIRLVQQ